MPCDYKNYPSNWTEIRAAILERAEDKCERCGLPNYAVYRWDEDGKWECAAGSLYYDDFQYAVSYAEAREACDAVNEWEEGAPYKVCVLTISHQNHATGDNRPENLRALCQRCHNRDDGEYRAENRRRKREAAKVDKQPGLSI